MMKFTRKLYQFTVLWIIAAFVVLAAFGSETIAQQSSSTKKKGTTPKTSESSSEKLSEPRWLSEGCEAFWNDKSEDPEGAGRLCAVGSSAGTYNTTTLRTSAEQRARERIAEVLGPEVKAIMEHYANSGNGHEDFGKPPDMEKVRNLSAMITQRSVLESQIISIWVPANNRMQVLVALDVEGFRNTVRSITQLSEKLREELLKRAEKGFKLIKHLEEEKS